MGTNQYIGPKGRTGFDVSFLYQKSGSNHAWLLPVGVSYRRAMGRNDDDDTIRRRRRKPRHLRHPIGMVTTSTRESAQCREGVFLPA